MERQGTLSSQSQVLPAAQGDVLPVTPPSATLSPAPVVVAIPAVAQQPGQVVYVQAPISPIIYQIKKKSEAPICPNWLMFTGIGLVLIWGIAQVLVTVDYHNKTKDYFEGLIKKKNNLNIEGYGAFFMLSAAYSDEPKYWIMWLVSFLMIWVFGMIGVFGYKLRQIGLLFMSFMLGGLAQIEYMLTLYAGHMRVHKSWDGAMLRYFLVYIAFIVIAVGVMIYGFTKRWGNMFNCMSGEKKSRFINVGALISMMCFTIALAVSFVAQEMSIAYILSIVGLVIYVIMTAWFLIDGGWNKSPSAADEHNVITKANAENEPLIIRAV